MCKRERWVEGASPDLLFIDEPETRFLAQGLTLCTTQSPKSDRLSIQVGKNLVSPPKTKIETEG